MRKRLRKKKRLGEFREYGFGVKFSIPDDSDWNPIFWAFVEEAIERNGLLFGGSPHGGFVTKNARRASTTENDRIAVEAWLKSRPEVSDITVGPLRDACHGWEREWAELDRP